MLKISNEMKILKSAVIVESINVISKETKIVGNINAEGNIRIEGLVDGSVCSQSKIIMGESAGVQGDIKSLEAEISGHVKGDVFCGQLLILKKSAVIDGNITTPKIVIENGAMFNGKCQMSNSGAFQVSKLDSDNEQKEKYSLG
jgi:cytoskeletal protein CcmA (bactofilin family)